MTIRLLEDGSTRRLEDGDPRLLEDPIMDFEAGVEIPAHGTLMLQAPTSVTVADSAVVDDAATPEAPATAAAALSAVPTSSSDAALLYPIDLTAEVAIDVYAVVKPQPALSLAVDANACNANSAAVGARGVVTAAVRAAVDAPQVFSVYAVSSIGVRLADDASVYPEVPASVNLAAIAAAPNAAVVRGGTSIAFEIAATPIAGGSVRGGGVITIAVRTAAEVAAGVGTFAPISVAARTTVDSAAAVAPTASLSIQASAVPRAIAPPAVVADVAADVAVVTACVTPFVSAVYFTTVAAAVPDANLAAAAPAAFGSATIAAATEELSLQAPAEFQIEASATAIAAPFLATAEGVGPLQFVAYGVFFPGAEVGQAYGFTADAYCVTPEEEPGAAL